MQVAEAVSAGSIVCCAAHLLHCCIIRTDGNELCKLVPRERMKTSVELHGSFL